MGLQVMLTAGKTVYDISEAVGTVEFSDNIDKSGVCTFPIVRNTTVTPAVGSAVSVKHDGVSYFTGFIFKVNFSQNQTIKVTCYDQLRYLKTQDTNVFDHKTLTDIVKEVCGKYGLRAGKLEDTGYDLGVQKFDGKDVLDSIYDCKRLTLRMKNELYYVKDEGGAVILRNIKSSLSTLLIDPESQIFGYDYERSIDGESRNQIKLVRDNKETGVRELYIAKDSDNIKAWGGVLQHYEKLDDTVNPEAAKQKADALLTLKNRVEQTLSLDVLGDKSVRAGNMLFVSLPDAGLKKYLLCTAAKHSFSNTAHMVKVTLRVV